METTANNGSGDHTAPPGRGNPIERRVAACLHADINGYTQLIAHDVEATVRMLTIYRAMLGRITVAHGGRVIDDSGDSLLAEFPTVTGAVRASIEIQRRLSARNAALPAHRRIEFRVGIDLGDVLAEGDRIYGECVNVAARVQELATPGGICLAGSAFDQIDGSLPRHFDYLGEQSVKNVERPLRVYRFTGE